MFEDFTPEKAAEAIDAETPHRRIYRVCRILSGILASECAHAAVVGQKSERKITEAALLRAYAFGKYMGRYEINNPPAPACFTCGGRGEILLEDTPCQTCKGTGKRRGDLIAHPP